VTITLQLFLIPIFISFILLISLLLAVSKLKKNSILLSKLDSINQKLKLDKSNTLRVKTNLEKKINILNDNANANDELLTESGETIAKLYGDVILTKNKLDSALYKIKSLEERNNSFQQRFFKIISVITPNLEFVNDSEKKITEMLNQQNLPIMASLLNILLDISRKNIIIGKKINKVMTAKSWTEVRVSREDRVYFKKISEEKNIVIFSQKKNQKADMLYMQKFN